MWVREEEGGREGANDKIAVSKLNEGVLAEVTTLCVQVPYVNSSCHSVPHFVFLLELALLLAVNLS